MSIEIEALHANIRASTELIYITRKQVGALCGLINQGLRNKDRKTRIAVLRVLCAKPVKELYGVDVQSTKNLTSPIASLLINNLREPNSDTWELSEYGKLLLAYAEDESKTSNMAN